MEWHLDKRVESALKEISQEMTTVDRLMKPYNFYHEEIVDLGIHAQKQGIELNAPGMHQAFKNMYTNFFGSNKIFLGSDYYEFREYEKHRTVMNQCWDVLEMKVEYMKDLLKEQGA